MMLPEDVRTCEDFYDRIDTEDKIEEPTGYLMEKYRGRAIYDESKDFHVHVEDIYHLSFEDLDPVEFKYLRLYLNVKTTLQVYKV